MDILAPADSDGIGAPRVSQTPQPSSRQQHHIEAAGACSGKAFPSPPPPLTASTKRSVSTQMGWPVCAHLREPLNSGHRLHGSVPVLSMMPGVCQTLLSVCYMQKAQRRLEWMLRHTPGACFSTGFVSKGSNGIFRQSSGTAIHFIQTSHGPCPWSGGGLYLQN